ncbi:MAG: hypothetical protein HMLIMOIP_001835 [Candidatus Nitrosomirales archaeon]|jgi:hypothetical protein
MTKIRNNESVNTHTMAPLVALLAVSLLVPYTLIPAFADATTFSGRAIGVSADVSVGLEKVDLKIADTGELAPEGGAIDATVLKVDHDLVQAQVLLSVTMGFDQQARSKAATAEVTLLPKTTTKITADFVRARSTATCSGVSGMSEIVNLTVAEESIFVSGEPNQKVSISGVGTLIINEQIDSSKDRTNEITVNALHLKLETVGMITGDVIISSARSDITCGEERKVPKDFVTGGGFINTENGRANFGFVAGLKPGHDTISGQLNYIDHAGGMHVKSTSIISYDGDVNTSTRTFYGEATVNGVSDFTFTVTVTDNGEPGRGADIFSIDISNGYYKASGVLAGGNIQLHT